MGGMSRNRARWSWHLVLNSEQLQTHTRCFTMFQFVDVGKKKRTEHFGLKNRMEGHQGRNERIRECVNSWVSQQQGISLLTPPVAMVTKLDRTQRNVFTLCTCSRFRNIQMLLKHKKLIKCTLSPSIILQPQFALAPTSEWRNVFTVYKMFSWTHWFYSRKLTGWFSSYLTILLQLQRLKCWIRWEDDNE
jgi:hypothetical protein